jgi:hypothetical protein
LPDLKPGHNLIRMFLAAAQAIVRHCEEPTGPAFSRPDDKLRDEAIDSGKPKRGLLRRWLLAMTLK